MDQFPQVLYKADQTRIVLDMDTFQAAIADGWFEQPWEAAEAAKVKEAPKDDAPPTRAELEQKATELGLKFDGRTTDRKLSELIAEKLKG